MDVLYQLSYLGINWYWKIILHYSEVFNQVIHYFL